MKNLICIIRKTFFNLFFETLKGVVSKDILWDDMYIVPNATQIKLKKKSQKNQICGQKRIGNGLAHIVMNMDLMKTDYKIFP